MARPEFENMSDEALKLRFSATTGVAVEGEALEILHELTRRGYLYDVHRRDFLTCEEWNQRYNNTPPLKCD
jgi:hypothetical protein